MRQRVYDERNGRHKGLLRLGRERAEIRVRFEYYERVFSDAGFCGGYGKERGKHHQYIEHERLSAADENSRIQCGESGNKQFHAMAGGTFRAV